MGDSIVRSVFGGVHDLAVPVLIGTSFIDRFVKGMFSLERKTVPYSSKTLPILDFKSMSEEKKDKDQTYDIIIIEENATGLLFVARQTKIPPGLEGKVYSEAAREV